MIQNKSFYKIKKILKQIYRSLINIINFFLDARLKRFKNVKESGKVIFKIFDYGRVTRMRANTFEIKEPETLDWINEFNPDDKLLDIGANIGIYSLYAASKGIDVIAIEPDALNYALLNLNIRLNQLGNKITPYCIAIHNETKFSKFNISSYEWGGALNSFDNNLDYKGDEYNPVHSQGVFGTSLDSFLNSLPYIPNHLKVDVDGNEHLILLGARDFLRNSSLKSILIELQDTREDYLQSIKIIEDSGFKRFRTNLDRSSKRNKLRFVNHIFVR